jgi:hypothetical protein
MKHYEIYSTFILIFLLFCLVANAGENGLTDKVGALQTREEPNLFELRSGPIKIMYSTTSLSGLPLFNYKDRQQTLAFQGEEIRQSDSEIGRQITVTIEQMPDLRTVTFTLLLPDIYPEGTETRFRTVGVITTTWTSIGGPDLVKGPIQTYVPRIFWGIARQVAY